MIEFNKYAITSLSASGKEKYVSGGAILAQQRGAVMVFIPDLVDILPLIWRNASRGCDDIIARNEKKVKV